MSKLAHVLCLLLINILIIFFAVLEQFDLYNFR